MEMETCLPVQVLYCKVCTIPAEYCEFGPDFEKCVKLSDASKKLGKKFATGASVVKGPTEKDQIDVQGDISFEIVDFITQTWPD